MHIINEDNIEEAYLKLVRTVLKEGVMVKDERGSSTIEILNVITQIRHPIPSVPVSAPIYQLIHPGFKTFWTGERLGKYCEEFISNDRKGFIYTYGNRYRGWFDRIDQIHVAIDRLKNCKESRRAISVTWDPTHDTRNDEVPCMILVDFKIRDGKLHTTALWRSHDIYGAWFPNIVGLTYLAQYVSKNLGVKIGSITIHSISAHIYKNDLVNARNLIKKERKKG